MLVLMNVQATPEQVANVIKHVRERGFEPIELPGIDRLAIGVLGQQPRLDPRCDLRSPGCRRRDPGEQAVQAGDARVAS